MTHILFYQQSQQQQNNIDTNLDASDKGISGNEPSILIEMPTSQGRKSERTKSGHSK